MFLGNPLEDGMKHLPMKLVVMQEETRVIIKNQRAEILSNKSKKDNRIVQVKNKCER